MSIRGVIGAHSQAHVALAAVCPKALIRPPFRLVLCAARSFREFFRRERETHFSNIYRATGRETVYETSSLGFE